MLHSFSHLSNSTSPFLHPPHLRTTTWKQWTHRQPHSSAFQRLSQDELTLRLPRYFTRVEAEYWQRKLGTRLLSSRPGQLCAWRSLHLCSLLADSRSCEIDPCHMRDHMAGESEGPRRFGRSCRVHWGVVDEALLPSSVPMNIGLSVPHSAILLYSSWLGFFLLFNSTNTASSSTALRHRQLSRIHRFIDKTRQDACRAILRQRGCQDRARCPCAAGAIDGRTSEGTACFCWNLRNRYATSKLFNYHHQQTLTNPSRPPRILRRSQVGLPFPPTTSKLSQD